MTWVPLHPPSLQLKQGFFEELELELDLDLELELELDLGT
jgi:hypothetical protein